MVTRLETLFSANVNDEVSQLKPSWTCLSDTGRISIHGAGTSVGIMFDPDQFPLPNGNQTPTHVALFHELVHAWHIVNGRFSEETRPNPRQTRQPASDWPSMEELNTIAAKVDLTENSYRRVGILDNERISTLRASDP